MTRRPPDFDELVGHEVDSAERERLRRAHDLLIQAGPPPELGPGLEAVPWPEEALEPLGLTRRAGNRKRSPLMIAAAIATVAVAAFLFGQATGPASTSLEAVRVVKMHGTSLARGATASIEVGRRGNDGNWPMILNVTNLRPLPPGGVYQLYLSKHGQPAALCGTFNVDRTETTVRMSAAYDVQLGGFDGWIVTRRLAGQAQEGAVYMTT